MVTFIAQILKSVRLQYCLSDCYVPGPISLQECSIISYNLTYAKIAAAISPPAGELTNRSRLRNQVLE